MSQRFRRSRKAKQAIKPADIIPAVMAEQHELEASAKPTLPWWHLAMGVLLTALCLGLYTRTADYPFQFDDLMYLKDNPLMREARGFAFFTEYHSFLNRPKQLGLDPDLAVNVATRPLTYATFYLNYLIDGFQPHWYRLFNVVIHTMNSILIYALANLMMKRRRSGIFIGAVAAILFAAHPMAIESVTYIVQRLTSLAAFFYLLTLCLHLKAGNVQSSRARLALRSAAVVAVLLGMLSKESVVTAPLVALLLDRIVVGTSWRKALFNATPLLLCLPVVPALVLSASWAQNGSQLDLSHAVNLVNSKDNPFEHSHYLLTQCTVVLNYLRQLFWPSDLNLDPEWPVYSVLFTTPVMVSITAILAIIAGAWRMHKSRPMDARFACLFASVIWFFGTIVISSGLVPLPDLMAEHRTYLPSIGIFLGVACLLDLLRDALAQFQKSWHRALVPALVGCCAVALSVVTWQRNTVWSTSVKLWEDTASKSPGKFRVWGNLAGSYALAGNYPRALECANKALAIQPIFVNAALLKASLLNTQGQFKAAFEEMNRLRDALPSAGNVMDVHYNVAISLAGLGQLQEGEKMLKEIIRLQPTHWRSYVALGLLYRATGARDRALEHWRIALNLVPENKAILDLIQSIGGSQEVVNR